MIAKIRKAVAPDRDNQLLARCLETASQPGFAGFTVNRDGLAAIHDEVDDQGRLFGFAVFCVVPQRERVRGWWSNIDLAEYLARFRLKTS